MATLDRAPRKVLGKSGASELVVVSPFFDAEEPAEPDDDEFLRELVRATRPDKVRLFAPVDGAESERPIVRISRALVDSLGNNVQLRGVPMEERRLHGKLVALLRDGWATILFGSANATTAGMTGRNVEACWYFDVPSHQVQAWLPDSVLLDSDEVRCQKPATVARGPSCPLNRATFSAADQNLELEWRASISRDGVILRYEGARVPGRASQPFRIRRSWSLDVQRNEQHWCVPIESDDALPTTRSTPETLTADDLLDALGEPPPIDGTFRTRPSSHSRGSSPRPEMEALDFHLRARRLTGKMAYARDILMDPASGYAQRLRRQAMLDQLVEIAEAHDPSAAKRGPIDAVWRLWVRCEVARLLGEARGVAATRRHERVTHLLNGSIIGDGLQDVSRLLRERVAR